jgi:hypothetical protein
MEHFIKIEIIIFLKVHGGGEVQKEIAGGGRLPFLICILINYEVKSANGEVFNS